MNRLFKSTLIASVMGMTAISAFAAPIASLNITATATSSTGGTWSLYLTDDNQQNGVSAAQFNAGVSGFALDVLAGSGVTLSSPTFGSAVSADFTLVAPSATAITTGHNIPSVTGTGYKLGATANTTASPVQGLGVPTTSDANGLGALLIASGTYTGTGTIYAAADGTAATSISVLKATLGVGHFTSGTVGIASAAGTTTYAAGVSALATEQGSGQTNLKKAALAATLSGLNDANDQDNYAATGGTNASAGVINAFAAKTTFAAMSQGVFEVKYANGGTGPLVVLLWGNADLVGSGFGVTGGTLYDPATAASSVPNIDNAVLNAAYPNWTNMLVFTNAQAADQFMGFNLPAGDTLSGVAVVPEPATLGLLALGAMGLLSRKRK